MTKSTGKNTTILLVEDEAALVLMYKVQFERQGYVLVSAGDAREGWQRIRETKPDLILLDLVLPHSEQGIVELSKADGYNLLKKLKEDSVTKSIPVVVLTNLAGEKDRLHSLKLGATAYITKPETLPREVVKVVEKILGQNGRSG